MTQSLLPSSKLILYSLSLSVLLTLTACASGMPKTKGLKIEEEYVEAVRKNCTRSFAEAVGGTIKDLWENKRLILTRSRECTSSARILADQVENRNRVIQ